MSELEHPTFPHLTKRIITTVHLQPNFHFGIPCADWLRFVMNRIDPAAPHKNPRLIGTRLRPIYSSAIMTALLADAPPQGLGEAVLGCPRPSGRTLGLPWRSYRVSSGRLRYGFPDGFKMARREGRSPTSR